MRGRRPRDRGRRRRRAAAAGARFHSARLPGPLSARRPVQRGEDAAARETLICRRGYLLAYNADMRNPDWVMEHLTPTEVSGTARRSNRFLHDPALPAGADAISADFSPPGNAPHYDRGHQAPAGEFEFDQVTQNKSFYFTNMSPQVGLGFNRAAWRNSQGESPALGAVRTSGCLRDHRPGLRQQSRPDRHQPGRRAGPVFQDRLRHADGYAVGFVMPNQAIGSRPVLQDYVVPIAEIENRTGLDFFSGFDERRQALLEMGPRQRLGPYRRLPGAAAPERDARANPAPANRGPAPGLANTGLFPTWAAALLVEDIAMAFYEIAIGTADQPTVIGSWMGEPLEVGVTFEVDIDGDIREFEAAEIVKVDTASGVAWRVFIKDTPWKGDAR